MPLPDRADRAAVALLVVLAAALLLPHLGSPYLWEDEAQTALLARTILHHGIPLGSDGTNVFSQEFGAEYGESQVWSYLTWLSFYLVAASFLVFGEGTAAARLPFALFGVATVALCYRTARSLWRDRSAAAVSAGLLALSVPFLLVCRQSRYYGAAAFFALLGLHAYGGLGRGRRGPAWLLFAAATLLFHTHYLYTATLLAALTLHAALAERSRLRPVLAVTAAVTLLNLPWVVWLAESRLEPEYAARRLGDASRSIGFARQFLGLVFDHLFDVRFLAIPAAFAALRALRRERPFALPAGTWSGVLLIALFAVVTIAALSFLAPLAYFRYLAPLAAPCFLLVGRITGALWRTSRVAGLAVIALWLALSDLESHLYEITHDFDGPIEGIVLFLKEHAREGDRVAITYGDLPVAFYTGLRVIGATTGQDPREALGAEWVILRKHVFTEGARRMRELLLPTLTHETYDLYRIDYPDTAWENRSEPSVHLFRTDRDEERVVIFGRKR